MGNFDGRGDSLDIKSDKERVLSFLISRIKHLLAIGTRLSDCSRRRTVGMNI